MNGSKASFRPDGSCRLVDEIDGTEVTWASVSRWADDWFEDRHDGDEVSDASAFVNVACDDAVPGVVDALVVLAEAAGDDDALLGRVGAGPLEHLVSHSGNGVAVLTEVDRAARQSVAFRAALRHVWLGADVPSAVRERLAELGARRLGGV